MEAGRPEETKKEPTNELMKKQLQIVDRGLRYREMEGGSGEAGRTLDLVGH